MRPPSCTPHQQATKPRRSITQQQRRLSLLFCSHKHFQASVATSTVGIKKIFLSSCASKWCAVLLFSGICPFMSYWQFLFYLRWDLGIALCILWFNGLCKSLLLVKSTEISCKAVICVGWFMKVECFCSIGWIICFLLKW